MMWHQLAAPCISLQPHHSLPCPLAYVPAAWTKPRAVRLIGVTGASMTKHLAARRGVWSGPQGRPQEDTAGSGWKMPAWAPSCSVLSVALHAMCYGHSYVRDVCKEVKGAAYCLKEERRIYCTVLPMPVSTTGTVIIPTWERLAGPDGLPHIEQ